MELKICHIYPDFFNLYGDGGNILCFKRRLEWRGIDCSVSKLCLGSSAKLSGFDLLFMGGGQDIERQVIIDDLKRGADRELKAAMEDGVTTLAICGGFQMLGDYFEDLSGKRWEGLSVLNMYTKDAKERLSGNYKFECTESCGGSTAVGFENHSGRTRLGSGLEPMGRIISGHGNNGEDGTEGAHYKNVFGSYAHGPLLPKNPALCDYILLTALKRKYGSAELEPLDDAAENAAHDIMCSRI